nr:hypothetical protein [Streptomyces sp. DSM 41633]
KMVGSVIQSQFLRVLDYPTAAALSFILMAIVLLMVTFYIRRSGTEDLVCCPYCAGYAGTWSSSRVC